MPDSRALEQDRPTPRFRPGSYRPLSCHSSRTSSSSKHRRSPTVVISDDESDSAIHGRPTRRHSRLRRTVSQSSSRARSSQSRSRKRRRRSGTHGSVDDEQSDHDSDANSPRLRGHDEDANEEDDDLKAKNFKDPRQTVLKHAKRLRWSELAHHHNGYFPSKCDIARLTKESFISRLRLKGKGLDTAQGRFHQSRLFAFRR